MSNILSNILLYVKSALRVLMLFLCFLNISKFISTSDLPKILCVGAVIYLVVF